MSDLHAQFVAFHLKNPLVYETLVRIARALKAAGHGKVSFRMVWESARCEGMIHRVESRQYAMPNSLAKQYAVYIQKENPDLWGFFTTCVEGGSTIGVEAPESGNFDFLLDEF